MRKKFLGSLLVSILITSFSFNVDTEAASRYKDQDVTAYVGDPNSKGKIVTSWGTTPKKYYTAAVHPKTYSTNRATAVKSGPVIPYGKTIVTDQEIHMPGYAEGWDDTFLVEDMGDTDGKRFLTKKNRNLTRYWFDIYFGARTNATKTNGAQFGVKYGIDYTVY